MKLHLPAPSLGVQRDDISTDLKIHERAMSVKASSLCRQIADPVSLWLRQRLSAPWCDSSSFSQCLSWEGDGRCCFCCPFGLQTEDLSHLCARAKETRASAAPLSPAFHFWEIPLGSRKLLQVVPVFPLSEGNEADIPGVGREGGTDYIKGQGSNCMQHYRLMLQPDSPVVSSQFSQPSALPWVAPNGAPDPETYNPHQYESFQWEVEESKLQSRGGRKVSKKTPKKLRRRKRIKKK